MKTFINSHKAVQQIFAVIAISALVFASVPVMQIAEAAQGAIWTTSGSCGEPQNINQYEVGETVFINGSGFDANQVGTWTIKEPGANGATLATGPVSADANGAFCVEALDLTEDHIGGPYQVDALDKNDNFSVFADSNSSGVLTVVKVLENEPEGVTADDFSFTIDGGSAIQFESDGSNAVVLNVNDSPFTVVEVEANGTGYTTSYSTSCTNLTLTDAGATCTITNTYEVEPVLGCTDPGALNYDDEATEDDGSCEYPVVKICKYDAGENLLAGWDVFLTDGEVEYGGTTGALLSEFPGCVVVEDVPLGEYTLDEELQQGWSNVSGKGTSVTVDEATEEFNLVNEMIVEELGSISGTKYDWDTEDTLQGWTIFIDENDNKTLDEGETSVVTDVNGDYVFNNLEDGTYDVCEVMQDSWVQMQPIENACFEITITEGSDSENNNFWNRDTTTVTVIKETIPDGSETGFNFYFGNAEEAFANLSDGESETENVQPGQVVIREGMIEDWILTDVSCEDEAENEVQGSLDDNEFTLTVDEGDDITCTFTNTFDGEVPEVPACTVDENLLLNGSFEDPDVVDNQWNIFTVVPNWIMSWVDDAVSATPSLELHGGVNGWLSFAGVQHAELDGDQEGPAGANAPGTESASTRIEQAVAGIVPGATYELSYRFSPRPDTGESENAVEAFANGELVDSVSADGSALANTDWQLRTTEFVATSSSLIVALQDAGTSNSVGTFIDDVRLCLVEEPVVNQCSVTAVSDTTNTVVVEGDDTNAELVTFIHPNWDEVIDGASWIWSEDPLTDAVNATTATFEKTFTFDGPVTSTELEIASDNTYEVYLNGNLIGSDISGGTFTNKDVYTNFNGFVVQGVNTLRVEVLNFADEDGTPESNPAGLLYKLTVTGSDETCGTLPDDGDDDDDDDNGGGGNGRKIELTGGGDDDEDEPEGEVLGAQTEILPAGAPNAGMGGAAAAAQGTTSLFALISLIASALFARKFTN